MRLVDCLERGDVVWCAIGGVAVNYWAIELKVKMLMWYREETADYSSKPLFGRTVMNYVMGNFLGLLQNRFEFVCQ